LTQDTKPERDSTGEAFSRSVRLLALLTLTCNLFGQMMVRPGTVQERRIAEAFNQAAEAPELKCTIRRFPPRLSFSFRYWSGYEITVPVRQLEEGNPARLQLAVRATPRGGAPRYFVQQRALPPLPQDPRTFKRAELYLSGGMAMGVGAYELSLQVRDSSGRTCRARWSVQAPSTKVPLRIDPGEVTDGGADRWVGIPEKESGGLVTVFLHAAPVFPRRNVTRLSPWDKAVLLGSLTSLLDTTPFQRARVVAYNLDNRDVVFQESDFGTKGFTKLVEELDTVNFGIISVETLSRSTPEDVLLKLVESELDQEDKADAIVFLGPLSRYFRKTPPEWKQLRVRLPNTYGIAVFPRFGQTGDLIHSIVKATGGDTMMVYQPSDLAKAVREISKVDAN
jgi:hypothetical protein